MPKVKIDTPLLNLDTCDFKLKEQTNCQRTVLKINNFQNTKLTNELTNEYRTKGFFEFQECGVNHENIKQIMLDRFGAIDDYNIEQMPNPEYIISLQATIQADQGIVALLPRGGIMLGDNNSEQHPQLLSQSGNFSGYATKFNIHKGGIAAKNLFAWVPRGICLGHLMLDPSRKVFATTYAHAQAATSLNLSIDVVPLGYKHIDLLSGTIEYDNRHLFTMPVVISNGSFLQIQELTKIIGPFDNQGFLETRNLEINSRAKESLWHVGTVKVAKDALLRGKFNITRATSAVEAGFYYCVRLLYNTDTLYFCNSDPAKLIIGGKLLGDATITKQGSWLHATQGKAPELQVITKDIMTCLYQKFISGVLKQN